MGSEVRDFQQHFSAQARGNIPYSQGFTIVGRVGKNRAVRSNVQTHKGEIVSISPAMAAVEAAEELIGGSKRRSRTKKSKRLSKKGTSKTTKKNKSTSKPKKKRKTSHKRK